ncbi:uncharacterized protein LOC128954822 [Oppia nitens]|uniref:uncharacterized protein LOC128954822 n=1 Tax=Oppia nitens TaxID=1686743 RepID=UPI0023D9C664|nr:uncharacterized protein LOC128954822 [Oppia nitens]
MFVHTVVRRQSYVQWCCRRACVSRVRSSQSRMTAAIGVNDQYYGGGNNGVDHQQRRYIRDYDKVVRLLPEQVKYDYKNSRFFNEHQLEDEPYLKYTDDQMLDLTKIKLEKDYPNRHIEQVDINADPYRQILVGQPDDKGFTETEVVDDPDAWFWVERLFPANQLPPMSACKSSADSLVRPPPSTGSAIKPDLPYFVARTRGHLLPVYRRYEVWDRDQQTYWRNRWDGLFNKYYAKQVLKDFDEIKWPNNEKTVTLTIVQQIHGDLWQLEADLRGHLEAKHCLDGGNGSGQQRILSAVSEVNGVLRLKGDYVVDCVNWLIDKGF